VNAIGLEFFEQTLYRHLEPSAQQRGLEQPPLERDLPTAQGSPIALPPAAEVARDLGASPVRDVVGSRRSVREFTDAAIGLEELSLLLWGTQGVRQRLGDKATFRTVPSAGARHAFETAIFVSRVQGLEAGAYQYLALSHALRRLAVETEQDAYAAVTAACLGQACVAGSAATFLWIADVERMTWRYGQRGYRYLLLDAGHVSQNLYLLATSLGLGACAIAAFDDEALAALLALDREQLLPIYLTTLGRAA
jgi:SagB-type dehydrogenase family enzyme